MASTGASNDFDGEGEHLEQDEVFSRNSNMLVRDLRCADSWTQFLAFKSPSPIISSEINESLRNSHKNSFEFNNNFYDLLAR